MSAVTTCKGAKICSPFLSRDPLANDTLYYVSAGTGEIFAYSLSEGSHTKVVFSGGEPYGAAFDYHGRLHIADAGHAALLRVDEHGQPGVMVKAYEERPFRGPSSVAFAPPRDGESGAIYFTDSGPLGETTLGRPHGSLFIIGPSPSGDQSLRPLSWEGLAHPNGLASSPADGTVLYVTEMMTNRLLRVTLGPTGVHYISVFYQFAGAMGPSCVACDDAGSVYVGHYDFAGKSKGRISILHADGGLLRTLEVPDSEITGICLSHDQSALYVTEAFRNVIYRIVL